MFFGLISVCISQNNHKVVTKGSPTDPKVVTMQSPSKWSPSGNQVIPQLSPNGHQLTVWSPSGRGGRYVLKIHFFNESGRKMIQFKIQFKTKSRIFIQKNIHSIESRIFNRIIHSQKMRKIIQNSKIRPKYGFGALLWPLYR